VKAILILVMLAAAPASASPRERAKESYLAGEAAFKLGRFEEALRHYTRAYELDAHPDMLFNIAQCHRNMKRWDDAIFFLERYLVDGSGGDREQIESLIRELELRKRAERPMPRLPAPPPPERVVETRIVTTTVATTVTQPVYVETPLVERGWFWGVVLGATAAVGGAVALAVWSQRDRIPEGQYEYDLR
jgi:tetratricopeptide (TPR) repeat protein